MDNNFKKISQVEMSSFSVADAKKHFSENAQIIENKYFDYYKQLVEHDGRKGVIQAFKKIEKIKQSNEEERLRVKKLYEFQNSIAAMPGKPLILGLDEVGRGPLAGPLTVGGVVLDDNELILGLNDSKQISETKRLQIAQEIKQKSIAYQTVSIPPNYIDSLGMTECLRRAFKTVIKHIEEKGIKLDVVLLDGNPLSIDPREVNVVKGDAKCACIAAASIVAKVERDSYMVNISNKYPDYKFDKNKGYGTAEHIEAIKSLGLSPIHRKSFCTSFMQMSLQNFV